MIAWKPVNLCAKAKVTMAQHSMPYKVSALPHIYATPVTGHFVKTTHTLVKDLE